MNAPQSMLLSKSRAGGMPAGLPRAAALPGLGLMMGSALVVVVRRMNGALETPLGPTSLLAVGLAAALGGAAIRRGWLSYDRAAGFDRTVMALTTLAVALGGAGVCLPGTPLWVAALFFAILAIAEILAWRQFVRPARVVNQPRPPIPISAHESSEKFPEGVSQQLVRGVGADGSDEFSGWLRTNFASGQRTASVHVAFCPPFACAPELEVEQIDGPEVRIKTAQLMPYGARLDLKLSAASEGPAGVVLQFSARAAQDHP